MSREGCLGRRCLGGGFIGRWDLGRGMSRQRMSREGCLGKGCLGGGFVGRGV